MSSTEYSQAGPQLSATAASLPFDLSQGQPIPAMPLNEHEAVAIMPVGQLLSLVPDPQKSEDPKQLATDPTLAAYANVRREVQRAVAGAKAKNAISFARYLIEGLRGDRPWIVP